MKKEHIFLASVYLLLSFAAMLLSAEPEEDEEHTNITGNILEVFVFFKIVNAFKFV
jgi:hypothetical protein